MNEDNKIFKTNEFSIEVSPVENTKHAQNVQYFSYDENSGLQLIHILMDGKPLDLPNGTEIRLSAVKLNNQNQKLIYTPEIVDPLKGIVSFVIPREFLGYQGQIRCGLYINFSNNQTMHVGYFYINMGVSDIDTNLTEFTEDFWQGWSEFEAGSTAKMQELEQRIDEQTEIFNNADVYNKAEIEDKLEPFAFRMDVKTLETSKADKIDLAQTNENIENLDSTKADKTALAQTNILLTNGLNSKVDKGGTSQITWPMIAQDVRDQMLGDTPPAIVGPGSVLNESIVEGSISPLKTDFIKTGKNLHDKSKIIDGYYLDKDNDVLIANASNFVTDYIYIGTNLPVSINILNSNLVGVINYCIYDLSKKRLRGGQLTKTNSNPITMGTDGYYLRLSAYKDYKTNLQVEIGSSSTDYESFYMQMDPKIKVTQEVVTDVFDPTEIGLNVSSEGFDLYVKGSKSEENLYFKYPIKKAVKDYVSGDYSSNYDTFNIVGGFKASRNNNLFSTGEKIVQNGEWEMAIKENGANDFIGGIAHGDEKLTAFAAFLDGKYISLDQSGTFLGREFVLECFSDLYRDTSITSGQLIKIAKHYKKYIFTKDGLLLQQRIEWIADVTLDNAYLCMLPIKRKTNDDNSGANITTNAMTANLINYDISESGWTSDLRTPTHGRERINMWGSDSGVSVFVENNPAPSLESSLGFVQNTVTYNKYYFDFSGSKSVKTGDIWENNTVFKIDVRNA